MASMKLLSAAHIIQAAKLWPNSAVSCVIILCMQLAVQLSKQLGVTQAPILVQKGSEGNHNKASWRTIS